MQRVAGGGGATGATVIKRAIVLPASANVSTPEPARTGMGGAEGQRRVGRSGSPIAGVVAPSM